MPIKPVRPEHATRRAAFTLMELLIVIGVIAIMIGLAIAVASKVTSSGKGAKTTELLKVLDTTVTEYVAVTGAIPGPVVVDPRRANQTTTPIIVQPVADAYTPDGGGGTINSVGLYMAQCDAQPSVRRIFETMDAKFMRELDTDGTGSTTWDLFPPLRTVFDGWDQPIRYVHPSWDGLVQTPGNPPSAVQAASIVPLTAPNTQYFSANLLIQRSNASATPYADGGICRGAQPYFYSCGPDGDPTTVDDNVYINKPEIEKD